MSFQEKTELWESKGITSKKIAAALFKVSEGDKRVLSTSERKSKLPNSVWGKAAKELFPDAVPSERDRFILYRFWSTQRKNVVGHFDAIKSKRIKPQKNTKKLNTDDSDGKPCICESCYTPLTIDRRVRCDRCLRWVHGLCLDVEIDQYLEDKEYVCKICTGKLVIPAVLDRTGSNSSSLSPKPKVESKSTAKSNQSNTCFNSYLSSNESDEDFIPRRPLQNSKHRLPDVAASKHPTNERQSRNGNAKNDDDELLSIHSDDEDFKPSRTSSRVHVKSKSTGKPSHRPSKSPLLPFHKSMPTGDHSRDASISPEATFNQLFFDKTLRKSNSKVGAASRSGSCEPSESHKEILSLVQYQSVQTDQLSSDDKIPTVAERRYLDKSYIRSEQKCKSRPKIRIYHEDELLTADSDNEGFRFSKFSDNEQASSGNKNQHDSQTQATHEGEQVPLSYETSKQNQNMNAEKTTSSLKTIANTEFETNHKTTRSGGSAVNFPKPAFHSDYDRKAKRNPIIRLNPSSEIFTNLTKKWGSNANATTTTQGTQVNQKSGIDEKNTSEPQNCRSTDTITKEWLEENERVFDNSAYFMKFERFYRDPYTTKKPTRNSQQNDDRSCGPAREDSRNKASFKPGLSADFSNLHNLQRDKDNKNEKERSPKAEKDYKELEENEENEQPIDTSNEKKSFTLHLSAAQWDSVVKWRGKKTGLKKSHFRVRRYYTNVLSRAFDNINKVCTVAFSKKKLADPLNVKVPFFVAYSHCSNKSCSAKYKFEVISRPKKGESVDVKVRLYRGEIIHYASRPNARRWTGDYRDEARAALASKLPAAARLDFCAKADKEAISMGRLTEIKTVKTFQMINQKMKKEKDRDEDVVRDVVLTKKDLKLVFNDKRLPGFVHGFMVTPAKVALYSYEQMEILKMLQSHKPVSLLLDATGSIVRSLGDIYDNGRMLLYTIIVKSPKKGKAPLPICEMVTSDNTHASIYTWLFEYFHSFQKRCGVHAKHYGVSKFEIDFSRAMLTSLVRLFVGKPLSVYLNLFWKYGTTTTTEAFVAPFPIHICRFHVLNAMRRKLQELFSHKNKADKRAIMDVYMTWVHQLVRSKDIFSFDRRCKDIAVISLFKYYTQAVDDVITNLSKPTERGNPPWADFVYQEQPSTAPFWFRSIFGQYCHAVFNFCEEMNAEISPAAEEEGYPLNPYYSKDFSDYLRTWFLPYFPIISHLVLYACNVVDPDDEDEIQDTNNPTESFFKFVKCNLYRNIRLEKLPRFIRLQSEIIRGMCNDMYSTCTTLGITGRRTASTKSQRKQELRSSGNEESKNKSDGDEKDDDCTNPEPSESSLSSEQDGEEVAQNEKNTKENLNANCFASEEEEYLEPWENLDDDGDRYSNFDCDENVVVDEDDRDDLSIEESVPKTPTITKNDRKDDDPDDIYIAESVTRTSKHDRVEHDDMNDQTSIQSPKNEGNSRADKKDSPHISDEDITEIPWKIQSVPSQKFKGKNYEKCSPERQKEVFKSAFVRPRKYTPPNEFIQFVPLIKYGGFFLPQRLRLTNTCNFDAGLQCLLAICMQIPGATDYLEEKGKFGEPFSGIEAAVKLAANKNFDESKSVWIKDVMNIDPTLENGNIRGNDFETTLRHIGDMFPIKKIHRCTNENCEGYRNPRYYKEVYGSSNDKWENTTISNVLEPNPYDFESTMNYANVHSCRCECGRDRVTQVDFDFNDKPFIMYALAYDENCTFDELQLPKTQRFGKHVYEVFAYTCILGRLCREDKETEVPHYIAKFVVHDKKVVYDGLFDRPYIEPQRPRKTYPVTSVWLVRKGVDKNV